MKEKNQKLEKEIEKNVSIYKELIEKIEKLKNQEKNLLSQKQQSIGKTIDELNNKINKEKEEDEKLKKDEEKKKEIFKKQVILLYECPALVGLNNIGAACFMNAILQCLSQTEDLTNYFLNQNNRKRIIFNNIALVNKDDLQLSPKYLQTNCGILVNKRY